MPTSRPRTPAATSPAAIHLAGFCLACRRFGVIATNSIADAVGTEYTDNASIAVLGQLASGPPPRLRELSTRIGLSSPTLSRVIDKLERRGDVRRRPGELGGDGRAVTVEITPRGDERRRRIEAALLANEAECRPDLDEALGLLDELLPPTTSSSPDVHVDHGSLSSALARSGLQLSTALKVISSRGDVTEALALMALSDGADSRPTRIGEQIGLSSGGTTKVLDRLEAAGFIERSFGTPGDRRGVAIHLTDQGRCQLERMATEIAPHVADLRPVMAALNDQLRSTT